MLSQQQITELAAAPKLWLGFSGGLDSSVLLHLLAHNPLLKPKLAAIHVHHGLSANADAWLAHCREQCRQWQIPFVVEKVQLRQPYNSLEQAARAARYQAYARHVAEQQVLLLAHHNDDQIETFFMRLSRGSGLQGLAGMAAQRSWLSQRKLVRPLLDIPRSELERYAQQHQLSWVTDESNLDNHYERNWWRNELLPRIYQHFPQRRPSLQRSLAQLQQDNALLQELLQPLLEQVQQPCVWPFCGTHRLDLQRLREFPQHYWPYLIKAWLNQQGVNLPSKRWLDRLLQELISTAEASQPCWQLDKVFVYRYISQLFIYFPPAQALTAQTLHLPLTSRVNWARGVIQAHPVAHGLMAGEYEVVASEQLGKQRIRPQGRPSKTLKALFQEANIPPVVRPHWPALMRSGQVCAVLGIAYDQSVLGASGWQLSWQAQQSEAFLPCEATE